MVIMSVSIGQSIFRQGEFRKYRKIREITTNDIPSVDIVAIFA